MKTARRSVKQRKDSPQEIPEEFKIATTFGKRVAARIPLTLYAIIDGKKVRLCRMRQSRKTMEDKANYLTDEVFQRWIKRGHFGPVQKHESPKAKRLLEVLQLYRRDKLGKPRVPLEAYNFRFLLANENSPVKGEFILTTDKSDLRELRRRRGLKVL